MNLMENIGELLHDVENSNLSGSSKMCATVSSLLHLMTDEQRERVVKLLFIPDHSETHVINGFIQNNNKL